jgi:hypothetical protein
MRVVVMAGLVGAALATPANACPQATRCIAMISAPADFTSIRASEIAPAPAAVPHVALAMRLGFDPATVDADRFAPLRSSLTRFRPAVAHSGDIEMPWIWAVLASEVHDRLPRYEQADQFSMVLSPVVVTMPTESTPGVGLSGDF